MISVERGLDPRDFALRRLRRRRARCTPARWPRSSGCATVLVPRAGGVLERARPGDLRRAARLRRAGSPLDELDRGGAGGGLRRARGGAPPSSGSGAEPPRRPALPRPVVRADGRRRRPRRAAPSASTPPTSGATATGRTTSRSSSSTLRVVATRAGRQAARSREAGRRRATPGRGAARACFDGEWRRGARARPGAALGRRLARSRARRSSSSAEATCVVRAGLGGRRSTTRARWCWSGSGDDEPRPRHALGARAAPWPASPRRWARCSIRGAYSSNIKERRDCSAALFDAEGRHGRAGRAHPRAPRRDARGGRRRDRARARARATSSCSTTRSRAAPTCPTSRSSRRSTLDGEVLGYAVTRAHHSDVGGMRAGLDARRLARDLAGGARHPAGAARARGRAGRRRARPASSPTCARRTMRRGDLRAQIAANRLAERRLAELVERRGRDVVRAAFDEVLAYAERRTREALRRAARRPLRGRGRDRGRRRHDDDIPIAVAVTIEGDELRDRLRRAPPTRWRATSTARSAVTRSACYFALRVLLPGDVPANAGAYAPLAIEAPEGSPRQRAAARPRWSPATSRPASGSPTPCCAALGAGRRPARAGPGDDEQPRHRRPRAGRTTRRSAAARAPSAARRRAPPASTSG